MSQNHWKNLSSANYVIKVIVMGLVWQDTNVNVINPIPILLYLKNAFGSGLHWKRLSNVNSVTEVMFMRLAWQNMCESVTNWVPISVTRKNPFRCRLVMKLTFYKSTGKSDPIPILGKTLMIQMSISQNCFGQWCHAITWTNVDRGVDTIWPQGHAGWVDALESGQNAYISYAGFKSVLTWWRHQMETFSA